MIMRSISVRNPAMIANSALGTGAEAHQNDDLHGHRDMRANRPFADSRPTHDKINKYSNNGGLPALADDPSRGSLFLIVM